MSDSVLNIGDVVVEVPAYIGQKVSGQEFTVIATYKNANGFWHVAETTDENGLKVQVPLNDGGPYLKVIKRATVKPVDSKPPKTKAEIHQDLERFKDEWRQIWGQFRKDIGM